MIVLDHKESSMNLRKFSFAALALLLLGAPVSAQQPGAGVPPRAGVSPRATAPPLLPKGKVAVINTGVFQQDVEEFKAKVEALNRQYEPRVKEIQGLADKINALET